MLSPIYWIDMDRPGRLAIMARPRAGDWLEEEINGWCASGVNVVVSLLEQEEAGELGLSGEAERCRVSGIEFISFPIRDRGVPDSPPAATKLTLKLSHLLADGKSIAIHCRAGIGRSSLIAACVLIHYAKEAPEDAFTPIKKARGLSVPDTDEQREWVSRFMKE